MSQAYDIELALIRCEELREVILRLEVAADVAEDVKDYGRAVLHALTDYRRRLNLWRPIGGANGSTARD